MFPLPFHAEATNHEHRTTTTTTIHRWKGEQEGKYDTLRLTKKNRAPTKYTHPPLIGERRKNLDARFFDFDPGNRFFIPERDHIKSQFCFPLLFPFPWGQNRNKSFFLHPNSLVAHTIQQHTGRSIPKQEGLFQICGESLPIL